MVIENISITHLIKQREKNQNSKIKTLHFKYLMIK